MAHDLHLEIDQIEQGAFDVKSLKETDSYQDHHEYVEHEDTDKLVLHSNPTDDIWEADRRLILRGYTYELTGHQTDNTTDKDKISFLKYVTVITVHITGRSYLHDFRRRICSGSIETSGSIDTNGESSPASAVIVFLKPVPRMSVQPTTRWYYICPSTLHVSARLITLRDVNVMYDISFFDEYESQEVSKLILSKDFISYYEENLSDIRKLNIQTEPTLTENVQQTFFRFFKRIGDQDIIRNNNNENVIEDDYENDDDINMTYEISFFDEIESKEVSKLTLSSDFASYYEQNLSNFQEFIVLDINIDDDNNNKNKINK